MLKFYLKKMCLNFTDSWEVTEEEMIDDPDDGSLAMLLMKGNFQNGLDKVIQSINNYEEA